MDKVYRKLEVCANIAIIVVAVLLAVILIRPLITTPTTSSTENSDLETPGVGA